MEQTLGSWVAPLLLIPGMALLVISTANRYSQLVLHLAENPQGASLMRELRALRLSLAALYLGIGLLAIAGLLGHALFFDEGLSRALILFLTCLGVTCLVCASAVLTIDLFRGP